jgi:hypothetical protein
LEDGIFTLSCICTFALRMRVSMSAMGSVIMSYHLPAGLGYARNFAGMHELAQAQTAKAELTEN